jgi:uncharacterized protein DUF2735
MTTDFQRGSAQIYQFPVGGRRALGGQGEAGRSGESAPVPSPTSLRFADAAFGGAWYHEQAVQDAERASRS